MTRVLVIFAVLGALALGAASSPDAAQTCRPTPPDALGPFYEPGAPVRSKVGSGYVLTGRVLTRGCRVIPRARIEFRDVSGAVLDRSRATCRPALP